MHKPATGEGALSTSSGVDDGPATTRNISRTVPAPGRWAWTSQRREALKQVMQGIAMTEVARRLNVHRHTVENWAKRPEWQAELRARLEEAQLSTRLRRMRATSVIADQLGARSLAALQATDVDTKATGLVLREHLNYVKAERELFGLPSRKLGSTAVVNITLGAGGIPPLDDAKAKVALEEFERFMAGYDPRHAIVTRKPDGTRKPPNSSPPSPTFFEFS